MPNWPPATTAANASADRLQRGGEADPCEGHARYAGRGRRVDRLPGAAARRSPEATTALSGGSDVERSAAATSRSQSGMATCPARRRSGPGNRKSLVSVTTIQDGRSSRPRWAFRTAGISTASAGSAGGVCVTGTTVTTSCPSITCRAATMAHGLGSSIRIVRDRRGLPADGLEAGVEVAASLATGTKWRSVGQPTLAAQNRTTALHGRREPTCGAKTGGS
jgi:hypothetical protein